MVCQYSTSLVENVTIGLDFATCTIVNNHKVVHAADKIKQTLRNDLYISLTWLSVPWPDLMYENNEYIMSSTKERSLSLPGSKFNHGSYVS